MKICTNCLLDETVPLIHFDLNGRCNFCKVYDILDNKYPLDSTTSATLSSLIENIKKEGKKKKYDCIVGVSGGVDSTYTMLKAVEFGLRPLAVHLDNGWDSEIAVKNIKYTCEKMGVDLYTYVIDWEEFKDLQLSFLKASVPDFEIPTDVAIHSTLVKTASKYGIKYILNGHSFRTEFVMPKTWTYMDGRYINSVQKKFGKAKLKSYPNFFITDVLYYNVLKGIKVVPFLNYFEYEKSTAKKILIEKIDWIDYGGHHQESIYTKFFMTYLLPQKFNIDKRKTEFSARVLSGKMSRELALQELKKPVEYSEENVDYVIRKLELSTDAFREIYNLPVKSFQDYPTYYPIMKFFKLPIYWACKLGILPILLYYKFLDD